MSLIKIFPSKPICPFNGAYFLSTMVINSTTIFSFTSCSWTPSQDLQQKALSFIFSKDMSLTTQTNTGYSLISSSSKAKHLRLNVWVFWVFLYSFVMLVIIELITIFDNEMILWILQSNCCEFYSFCLYSFVFLGFFVKERHFF
jgi:hypothetical protein